MKHKNSLKLFASAVAIIGIGAVIFNGTTDTVMAASLKSAETVPTNYQVPSTTAAAVPEGYEKAGYRVFMEDLSVDTPTAADLTMEEAAESGAQYLWKIYELDLEGANVAMMYSLGSGSFPRASWMGTVYFSDEWTAETTHWTFWIDAVTGELFSVNYSEHLNVKTSLAADPSLETNFDSYAELTKKQVELCGLMSRPVSRVTYNGQGYTGNNPDVTFNAIGENGETVLMTFSRYNQKLLGITTDSLNKIRESSWNNVLDESECESQTIEAN